MNKLILLSLALLATACGGTRGRDPLAGLAGPTDSSRYGFESTTQGWGAVASTSDYSVFQSPGQAFFGTGCLALAVQSMSFTSGGGAVEIPLPGGWVDAGKTITAWLYAPQGAQLSDSMPTYSQIYIKNTAGAYSNGPASNALIGNWVQLTFSPVVNPQGVTATVNGNYCSANFDPTTVDTLGIKIGVQSGFTYTGVFLIDSVNW